MNRLIFLILSLIIISCDSEKIDITLTGVPSSICKIGVVENPNLSSPVDSIQRRCDLAGVPISKGGLIKLLVYNCADEENPKEISIGKDVILNNKKPTDEGYWTIPFTNWDGVEKINNSNSSLESTQNQSEVVTNTPNIPEEQEKMEDTVLSKVLTQQQEKLIIELYNIADTTSLSQIDFAPEKQKEFKGSYRALKRTLEYNKYLIENSSNPDDIFKKAEQEITKMREEINKAF